MSRRQPSYVTVDLFGSVSEWVDNVRFDTLLAQKRNGRIPPHPDLRPQRLECPQRVRSLRTFVSVEGHEPTLGSQRLNRRSRSQPIRERHR